MIVWIVLLAFSGGLAVGVGIAALFIVLKLPARLAHLTGTANILPLYSLLVAMGTFCFTWITILKPSFTLPPPLLGLILLSMGCFTGMQACALAEVMDELPTALRGVSLSALKISIFALAISKTLFSIFQLYQASHS